VQTITQQVSADDVLWFFFSGYGVQLDGDDYLMPIDGDPGQIKATGLAAVDLIETLAQLPTDKTLLVLDINRSQGSFSGQAIGQQMISLAEANAVPLLLSCQPEQYSHETFGVRHGLFTAALLEALQQKCMTLGDISNYVSKRLPELCEHHWRPIQNPVGILGDAQRTLSVVPESQSVTDVASTVVTSATSSEVGAGVGAEALSAGASPSVTSPSVTSTDSTVDSTVLAGAGGTLLTTAGVGKVASDTASQKASQNGDRGRTNASALAVSAPSKIVPVAKDSAAAVSGAKLRNWGLAALALLVVGVLLKQPFVRTAWMGFTDKISALADRPEDERNDSDIAGVEDESVTAAVSETGAASEAAVSESSEAAAPDADAVAEDPDPVVASTPSEATDSEAESTEVEPTESEPTESGPTEAEPEAETTESEPTESAAAGSNGSAANNPASVETKALLAEANAALSERQYSEALMMLQQVPKEERDSAFSSILTKARAGAAEAQQYNASVLTDARTSIQPTQASQFSNAIAKARLIAPGEPYYEEAQQDIRSWSQIILDIAEGRATSGNLNGAIAAANVMPQDNSEFHQKAQDRIVFWQERQNSRDIITTAQAIPRSGQASTYQKGIVKLREVPIEHPEYETAQRLADEWSDRIFSIAQARAAQGRRRAAIQAAVLVPAGTTSYEPTQQAIKRWQSEE